MAALRFLRKRLSEQVEQDTEEQDTKVMVLAALIQQVNAGGTITDGGSVKVSGRS